MYNLGQYVPRESPIHNLDPRVKIIAVLALSIIILQVNTLGLLVATSITMACFQLARIPCRSLLKTLRPVLPVLSCLFFLYLFFTPGRPLPPFPMGPVQISYQGLQFGIFQIWKFLLLVLAASILTLTTPQSEIIIALERLLRPIRIIGISSHDIAIMVSLALGFIPTLIDEKNTISEAQLARGANFTQHRMSGSIRAIICLATPLSVSIIRRCDELVDAMEARGYHQGRRTYLRELVLSRLDYRLIGTLIIVVLVVLAR